MLGFFILKVNSTEQMSNLFDEDMKKMMDLAEYLKAA